MKTSEFRKWLEENNVEFTENMYQFQCDNDGWSVGKDLYGFAVRENPNNIPTLLLQKIIEYYLTPLEEREDEKEYKIIISNKLLDVVPILLTKQSNGKVYFSVHAMKTNSFTQSEIDNLPKEIKGAIECGFLKKVEVE